MLITLLTDFGTSDYFVAAMKGRILGIDPAITIVDITHDVPPHDIEAGAFLIRACYRDFPAGTVHLAVVDPGVGSSRLPIVAQAGGQLFVAPDNGILSYILDEDRPAVVRSIHPPESGNTVSATFHGRDIFAPAAARLAKGQAFEETGPRVSQPVRLQRSEPGRETDGSVRGRIIHVDHFGNCITGFRPEDLPEGRGVVLEIAGVSIREVRDFYESSAEAGPFLIEGSAGFLEISMLRASAARTLGIGRGAEFVLHPLP